MTNKKVNIRAVPVQESLESALEGGFSELNDLMNECQEIVDNATEALQQTQRIQTLEQTASELYQSDSAPDIPNALCEADLQVNYTEDRRKSKSTSRATRCAEACAKLYAVIAAVELFLETNESADEEGEIQSFIDEVQEMIDSAEGCEFPGMFG